MLVVRFIITRLLIIMPS